jgi:transposase InsO family protein
MVIIEQWRIEYIQMRPHSALGYLTPEEFAARATIQSGELFPRI